MREHSAQEIREIYEVRAALEGFAARLAAERVTDAMLDEIRAIHETYVKSLDAISRPHLVQHNDDFHDAVVRASGNARLADQVKRNTQYYFIRRIGGFLSDDEVRVSIAGHQELVDALLSRDPDRAEYAARTRVLRGLDKTLARLR